MSNIDICIVNMNIKTSISKPFDFDIKNVDIALYMLLFRVRYIGLDSAA